MAELDVVRKKKSAFPWILLALILVAVAGYFIWQNYANNNTATPVATDSTGVVDTTNRVPQ